MNINEFIKHMTFLSVSYNRNIDESTYRIWYESFKDIESSTLGKAIRTLVKNKKFIPSVAEVLEECEKVQANVGNEIIEKMIDDGFFKTAKEIEKAYTWVKRKNIPEWFLEEMKSYGYESKKIANQNILLI